MDGDGSWRFLNDFDFNFPGLAYRIQKVVLSLHDSDHLVWSNLGYGEVTCKNLYCFLYDLLQHFALTRGLWNFVEVQFQVTFHDYQSLLDLFQHVLLWKLSKQVANLLHAAVVSVFSIIWYVRN